MTEMRDYLRKIQSNLDKFGVHDEIGYGRGNEAQIYKESDGVLNVEVKRVFDADWNEKTVFGGRKINPKRGREYRATRKVKTVRSAAKFITDNLWFDQ